VVDVVLSTSVSRRDGAFSAAAHGGTVLVSATDASLNGQIRVQTVKYTPESTG
jgi:hypothetical protein